MGKVFSDFFTSFAVAWATAGFISPFLTTTAIDPAQLAFFGIIGTLASLSFAIMFSRIKQHANGR